MMPGLPQCYGQSVFAFSTTSHEQARVHDKRNDLDEDTNAPETLFAPTTQERSTIF
jgi:hypothetical protein